MNLNAFDTIKVEFEVPGYTGLAVGEVDMLNLKSIMDEDKQYVKNFLNGRYLVSSIRHQVSRSIEHHSMIIEGIKDSLSGALPESLSNNWSEKDEKGQIITKLI